MIKAVIFDLDGVLIESAGIKTRAFGLLFADYGDRLSEIVRYHEKNAGISRYVKFRYIYDRILGQELSQEKERELGERFSRIVLGEIMKAPLVAGVEDFLKNNHQRYLLFVVSGTPQEELRYILSERGLDIYFQGAYGTPATKPELIRQILAEHRLARKEVVFVGDAESDKAAAAETGLTFIARTDGSNEALGDCAWKIRDLTHLTKILDKIANGSLKDSVMGAKGDLTRVINNPSLIPRVPGALLIRYAHFIIQRQVHAKACLLDTAQLDRDHYGWQSISNQFNWDIFCIQQTNLINFVKKHASEHYQVVAEVGATSDMFLKHVKAETKKGINILDVCIEQLNRQGIIGVKSLDEKIPLADNEADLTICFETLEHVHNPLLFLSELARITRKRLLLSIPWVLRTNIRAKWHGGGGGPGETPDTEFHVFEFDEKDFKKLLSYTDFEVVDYARLINYEAKYDPFTNWCLRKYFYLSYFPVLQAYVLAKRMRAEV